MQNKTTKDLIWTVGCSLEGSDAQDILIKLLKDDKYNYDRAISEFRVYIQALDDAIVLFIELLQTMHNRMNEWKDVPNIRAAIALAQEALNYVLLARHGVLLGYLPEVRVLVRSCYEYMTRSYLYFHDESEAKKFLSGKTIKQAVVDQRLRRLIAANNPDEANTLYKIARDTYSEQSELIHPNILSLASRTLSLSDEEVGQRAGIYPRFGGYLSNIRGKSGLLSVAGVLLMSLRFLRVICRTTTAEWDERFIKVNGKLSYDLAWLGYQ